MIYAGNREVKEVWACGRKVVQAWAEGRRFWGGDEPAPEWWGLTFTAQEPNSTVSIIKDSGAPEVNVEYSTDGVSWSEFVVGETVATMANVGDKVMLRAGPGGNTTFANGWNTANRIVGTGKFRADGSIMSLIDGEHPTTTLNGRFSCLFRDCQAITKAPDLPATTIYNECYQNIFWNCSSLVQPPDVLPALSAPTTSQAGMFQYTAISSMPVISATTFVGNAMQAFVTGAFALREAHFTPTQGLQGGFGTFNDFFANCSNLSSISVDFTSWPSAAGNWVNGVAASGKFYCPEALGTNTTILRGPNNCPNGWTVINPSQMTTVRYADGDSSVNLIGGDATRADFEAVLQKDGKTSADIYGVDFGSDVTSIAPSCFADWGNLREVKIGDNVQTVGNNAFRRRNQLSSVQWGVGGNLTTIGQFAFAGVQNCVRYDLPAGVQTIGANAFQFNGSKLTAITVPQSVTHIGGNAFGNSGGLLSVVFHGKTMNEVSAMTNYPWGASGKIFVD